VPLPIAAHGFEKLVEEARAATERLVHPSLMQWLPNGLIHFIGIS
jgi:hypothetical protein